MRRNFTRKRIDPALVEEVVAELLKGSYIDDAAFARRFAEDRRNLDAWGAERIERRLNELGVDRPRSAPPWRAAAVRTKRPATTSWRRPAACSPAASHTRPRRRAISSGRSASSSARATSSSSRTTRCAGTRG